MKSRIKHLFEWIVLFNDSIFKASKYTDVIILNVIVITTMSVRNIMNNRFP